jgi:hypothetical protein
MHRFRALDALLVSCIAVAIAFRVAAIDHIPGINGDEAYLGTQAYLLLHGGGMTLLTGSGLLPDPISLALSALLHLVMRPSVMALRLPTVLIGAATIGVAYDLSRRLWGREVALLAAAFVAVLPAHIAYSRFFWEPSQSPFVCMLWLYAACARKPIAMFALALLAVMIHPTNIFLAPVIAVLCCGQVTTWRRREWLFGAGSAVLLLLYLHEVPRAAAAVNHTLAFVTTYPGVVTGASVYAYIVGALSPAVWTAHRLAYLAFFCAPVAVSLVRDRARVGAAVVGLLAALAIFYGVAGAGAVMPHTERYAMWMTIPHCLIAAIALAHVCGEKWAKAAAAAICAFGLFDFQQHYFARFTAENSTSHKTFLSGPVEPKESAVAWIAAHHDPARAVRVICDDWWSYYPIKYLSLAQPERWQVTIPDQAWSSLYPRDFILPESNVQTFWVSSAERPATHQEALQERISGYAGRAILDVFMAP